MVTLKDLKYFNKLADIKNITETAHYFNISQPTMSYSIKRLEEDLECQLIYRNYQHHTIHLTKAGEAVKKHYQNIEDEIQNMYKEISNLSNSYIICGIPPMIGNVYFTPISIGLIKNKRMKNIKILNEGSEDLLLKIKEGDIDIGIIGSLKLIEDNNLKINLVKKESFSVVAAKNHFPKDIKSISFKNLKNELFITLDEHYIHNKALNILCNNCYFSPNIIYKNGDLNILKKMIKEDIGIGILANTAIEKDDNLQSIPIKDLNQPYFYIQQIYRKEKENTLLESNILSVFEHYLFH